MTTVNVTYYGMDGAGRNVTEAKRAAGAKIESAMTGSYQPKIFSSRGYAVMVWRDPCGWRNSVIASPNGFYAEPCYSSGREDYWDECARAILDLAQLTWDGAELIPPCLAESEKLAKREFAKNQNTGRRLLGEFASWRGFQLAYRHAKANGIGENDCDWHRWGCEHSGEFATLAIEAKVA